MLTFVVINEGQDIREGLILALEQSEFGRVGFAQVVDGVLVPYANIVSTGWSQSDLYNAGECIGRQVQEIKIKPDRIQKPANTGDREEEMYLTVAGEVVESAGYGPSGWPDRKGRRHPACASFGSRWGRTQGHPRPFGGRLGRAELKDGGLGKVPGYRAPQNLSFCFLEKKEDKNSIYVYR